MWTRLGRLHLTATAVLAIGTFVVFPSSSFGADEYAGASGCSAICTNAAPNCGGEQYRATWCVMLCGLTGPGTCLSGTTCVGTNGVTYEHRVECGTS